MRKASFLTFLLLLLYSKGYTAVDTLVVQPSAPTILMAPYFQVVEDEAGVYSADSLFAQPELFRSLSEFQPAQKNSVFWLYSIIKPTETVDVVVSFKHLSYADLYIVADTTDAPITHQSAGAFRVSSQIQLGDTRFTFRLQLKSGISYRMLIRSHHTKQYKPIFDFELSNLHRFEKVKSQWELVDIIFLGAGLLLVTYVFISWLMTRYKPYLWLVIFVAGMMLYRLALGRYLIDWFFPEKPITGWLLTIHFLHPALAGLYLLILDFCQIKEKSWLLYRFGKIVLYSILVNTMLAFLINYYTSNFQLSGQLNGLFLIVQFIYLFFILTLWKKLDQHQRFLGYGIVLYLLLGFTTTMLFLLLGEVVFTMFGIILGSLIVFISLFFLTGINGKLWKNEKDKTQYLSQLNQLQKQQNELLEENVTARTKELNERNARIELLMNELNHRVKNNLQFLYSMNSLQLASNKDHFVGEILRDNVARIKSMMLVNDALQTNNNEDNSFLSAAQFLQDITDHAKVVFTSLVPVDICLLVDDALQLKAKSLSCLGLIVTELITNSCKHAFSHQPLPKVVIDIKSDDDCWKMHYSDNGTVAKTESRKGFGLSLITDLTRQLRGQVQQEDSGSISYFFTFPKNQ